MPAIMSLLVFQSSRLQLLASLKHRFDSAAAHRDEHLKRGESEDDHEKKSIDNLLKAMEAADEQCKRLEFWSDFRTVDQKGGVLNPSDHSHGIDHKWTDSSVSGSGSEESSTSRVDQRAKGKDKAVKDSGPTNMGASGGRIEGASEKQVERSILDNNKPEKRSPNSKSEHVQEAKEEQGDRMSAQDDHSDKTELDDTPDLAEKRQGEEEQEDVD
jgi:hypothetical protein